MNPNAGLFLWQVSALIAAWSPNFNCLLAARLLSGVGQAFVVLKKNIFTFFLQGSALSSFEFVGVVRAR